MESNQYLNQQPIESIRIQDSEIRQILQRLASSNSLADTSTSTVRDVAEATETSPEVIARILSDIRGQDVLSRVIVKVGDHEERIQDLEQRPTTIQQIIVSPHNQNPSQRRTFTSGRFNRRNFDDGLDGFRRVLLFIGIGLLVLFLIAANLASYR